MKRIAAMNQRMNIGHKVPESKSTKLINVSEEQQVQIFAKQMLAKRLFVGHYQERRYVEALNSYRDVISVSNTEDDLPRDLSIVKKRIQQIYPSHIVWTGITGPDMIGAPTGCCLWVKLSNLPFGHYWFQIREVIFEESTEICVRVKCLRSISPGVGIGSSPNTSNTVSKEQSASSDLHQDKTSLKQDTVELTPTFDIQKYLSSIKGIKYNELIAEWVDTFSVLLTLNNIQRIISFLVVLLLAAATGFLKCVVYVGEFSLKLMREITLFVRVCTPIFLGIIDLFSKCFGGILILITVLWRGSPPSNAYQQNFTPRREPLALPASNNKFQPPPTYRQNRNYSRPYF